MTRNPTDIGVGGTCCLTSLVVQSECRCIGGYSEAGTFEVNLKHIITHI